MRDYSFLLNSGLLCNPCLCFSKIMSGCFSRGEGLEKDSEDENSDDRSNR
jgi:hypothetical protein